MLAIVASLYCLPVFEEVAMCKYSPAVDLGRRKGRNAKNSEVEIKGLEREDE